MCIGDKTNEYTLEFRENDQAETNARFTFRIAQKKIESHRERIMCDIFT